MLELLSIYLELLRRSIAKVAPKNVLEICQFIMLSSTKKKLLQYMASYTCKSIGETTNTFTLVKIKDGNS